MKAANGQRRVLFVESYPHCLLGQQKTLLNLLKHCPERGIAPVVAVPIAKGPMVDELRTRQIAVEEFQYPNALDRYGGTIYRDRGLKRGLLYAQTLAYIWNLRKRLKCSAPTAVFCNDMRGLLTVGLAARTRGIPVVMWDKLDKPHGWLDALQLPIASLNPVISEAVLSKYPRWQKKAFARKISVTADGVDLSTFRDGADVRSEFAQRDDDILIGVVGSITHRKGQDRVLRIFPRLRSRHPHARLILVGDVSGSEDDETYKNALLRETQAGIVWAGYRHDIPEVMRALDILLIPSRREGLGLVAVEAMAAGKPVVGARTGGIPEVVAEGETGLLFNGDDPEELLHCLELLVSDPALRSRMGAAGRRRAEALFDCERQADKILALLERSTKTAA